MKIIFFTGSMKLGGAERAVSKLANHWAGVGHDISIITMTDRSEDFYDLHSQIKRIGLNVMEPRDTFWQKLKLQMRRMILLSAAIRKLKPDVMISFNTDANILALETGLLYTSPLIISERTNPDRQVIKKLPSLLRRILYPFARKTVFVSEGVAKKYHWLRDDRKTTILNPVVTHSEKLNCEREKTIIALGRLLPVKGYDILIKSFSLIAKNYPDWSLTIYGDGAIKRQLESQISELRLSDQVSLGGHTKNVYPLLNKAGIYVLSSRYEGFPNSLMEAMSVGAPCISFDCESGPNEMITNGHDGLLVAPEDEIALADAIAYMIENPVERDRMGRNAAAINDRLSFEAIMPQWERLIEELTGKSFGDKI